MPWCSVRRPENGANQPYLIVSADIGEFRGFAAFDLSDGISTDGYGDHPIRIRFIHLPIGFSRGWRANPQYVCHGVVGGVGCGCRWWLKKQSGFVVKVWELNHNTNNNDNDDLEWLLMHEVTLKKNDTNAIVLCDNDLLQIQDWKKQSTKKSAKLPDCELAKHFLDNRTRYLRTFTLSASFVAYLNSCTTQNEFLASLFRF
ncbi:hypothetical protein PanWU01x14_339340 [Parasponia andersonii]|uniref:Uncharacterized protein n=1 Tax=Parasponia andersonii TaxID=3476 RepID=A0A2P5AEU1_PARAD|nr:hypothetical protein PanWU01x14_339340 [Parasponia andersonii]